MQAIILAAGMGKRLGELTSQNTKCMVKVLGKTLIERVLSQLIEVGIKKTVIVVGYKGDKLIEFVGHDYNGMTIEYVDNKDYYKTNNIYSLYLAKDYLASEDSILLESDLIFDTSILKSLLENTSPNVVAAAKLESWMDGTVVTMDENDQIISFVPKKKFDYSKIEDYYKTINIYKFEKSFSVKHYIPFLEAYCKSMGDNEYYEEVLRVIAFLEKSTLKAMVVDKSQKWYEIDDVQDLQIAETLFEEEDKRLEKYHNRYGGYWRFPKLIDFCYLVNPYFPSDTLKNEIKANFNVLIEQYPSGQEVNRSIAAKIFGVKPSQILVGNGAAEIINILMSSTKKITGIVLPTFEEYYNRLDKSLVKTFLPSNNDFSYDVKDLIKFSDQVEQLLLINPDNPSGNFICKNDILELLNVLKAKNKTLILDESFVDFTDIGGGESTLIHSSLLDEYKNLVIIKSISKSYGVPGVRLGIIASGDEALLAKIKPQLTIWNINSFGEFFMQIFDKYQADYVVACKKMAGERGRFFKELSTISYLRVINSQSNYFLCEVKTPYTSHVIAQKLLNNYNLLIKDCSDKLGFEGRQFVRIAIRNTNDNNLLIFALKELLK